MSNLIYYSEDRKVCFRHAVVRAMMGKEVLPRIGTITYACEDCKDQAPVQYVPVKEEK